MRRLLPSTWPRAEVIFRVLRLEKMEKGLLMWKLENPRWCCLACWLWLWCPSWFA